MTTIGFSAALEQLAPLEAVELAASAEAHGFSGVMASDHFQPWVPQQGESPFVWNVLTAIAERTRGDVGPGVTAPTFRMHPATVAQASATLGAMYPGRHWLGIGSGEALSEHVVGQYWPEAPERIDRMFEAVEIIQRLFASGIRHRDVKFDGRYFKLETTRLWTMPEVAPEILIATAGPVTARRAGKVADGLITVGAPVDKLANLIDRFAEGRRWRFDFAWPGEKLAVEVEGGIFTRGRHTRGTGMLADMEKYNRAALLGWRVLRFFTDQVRDGTAIATIKEALT